MKLYQLTVNREWVGQTKGTYRPITSPKAIAKLAAKILCNEDQEVFIVFLLNQAHMVLGYSEIARGTMTACEVDPKVLFRVALMTPSCVSLLIAHNHLSGEVKPSLEDRNLTQSIKKACGLLGFRLLDHVVVASRTKWFSYAESTDLLKKD
jgi:DNA repair protein RadC